MQKIVNILNVNAITTIPVQISSYIAKHENVHIQNEVLNHRVFFKRFVAIANIIKTSDIAHSHHTFSSVILSLFYIYSKTLRRDTKFVHTIHRNFSTFSFISKIIYALLIFPFRDTLIVNSQATRSSLFDVLSKNKLSSIKVIPNGVDFSVIPSRSHARNDLMKIVNIARMVKIKDQATIIRAVKKIYDKGINVSLDFCGDGVLEDDLRNLVSNYNLNSVINFHGIVERKEVYRYLTESDFSVVSSFNEGFGVATIESMAAGSLVLATDIPIHKEIINDYDLLFPVGDADALANKLIYFFTNPDKISVKLNSCISRSRFFDINNVAKMYVNYYQKLILTE